MGTLVAFHAHPDDEAIATGGSMRLAADAGHRVVLVVATRGECGEVNEGLLDADETLGQRREAEQRVSADLLGAHRVEFLGYRDSGMIGEPSNDDPTCFWQADVETAAVQLAAILKEENADVLTCYDSHGGYGHPDHIQVHRVGHRAADMAGIARVYEATMNRTRIAELRAAAAAVMTNDDQDQLDMPEATEDDTFGSPDEIITTAVDVSSVVSLKRQAMAAHASQIDESSFFMQMPEEIFEAAFGIEWFIRTDAPVAEREPWLFDEPAPSA